MYACKGGHKSVIERLLLAGANANLQRKDGSTVMHLLARKGQVDLIELMMPFASLGARDADGRLA